MQVVVVFYITAVAFVNLSNELVENRPIDLQKVKQFQALKVIISQECHGIFSAYFICVGKNVKVYFVCIIHDGCF